MHLIDYLVIILFSLLVVVSGLAFRKNSGGNMKSYFAAGGAVPWGISGLSLFMSFFSAGTFVVWGSIAYEQGWVAITIQLAMCIGGFIVAYSIAPAWRKTHALTAAEFVRFRLGERLQKFYTYVILLISLAYAGAFLYPVAKIISVSMEVPINAAIVVLGLLILSYTLLGGLWAVIITDVLQFVILTAAVIMVVYFSLDRIGGVTELIQKAPQDFFAWTTPEYNSWFIAAFVIYNTIFIGGNWAYVQRYTSVKNAKSAKKVGLTFGVLYMISPLIWMLPPMVYRIMNPDLSGLENEGAYLLVCKEVLPIGMLGLMLGGMVFAAASSVNTTLNFASSVITNDVYRVLRPQANMQHLMRVAKISTMLFGLATIGVALLVPMAGGIVNVVLTIGAVTGCSLYAPPIWALFSKKLSGKAVLWITIISLTVNVGLKFLAEGLFGSGLSRANEMVIGALLPLALLGVCEIWASFRPSGSAIQTKSSAHLKMVKETDEAAQGSQNTFGLKVLGTALMAVAILVIIIGFIPQKIVPLTIIMGVGILLLGGLIHPYGKNKLTQRFKG